MRHRVQDKKFNREANERKALFGSLLRALSERGAIVTTRARGKVLQRLADKAIGQAKDNSLASRRLLHKSFGKRDVVNTLVDVIAPVMNDRKSGFTRLIPMGNRRGDNTPMVKVELVNKPEKIGTFKSGKEHAVRPVKAAKPAKAAKAPAKKTESKAAKAPVKKAAPKAAPKKKVAKK